MEEEARNKDSKFFKFLRIDIQAMEAPTTEATLQKMTDQKNKERLTWHRLSDVTDATIMVEAFNQFMKIFDSDIVPKENDVYETAFSLLREMPKFYKSEPDRTAVIAEIFSKWGVSLSSKTIKSSKRSDSSRGGGGVLDLLYSEKINGVSCPLLVMEIKNELFIGSTEAIYQAMIGTAKIVVESWNDEGPDERLARSKFPVFIVVIAGPWICVGGFHFKERFYFDAFTGFHPMWWGSDRESNLFARLLFGLKTGMNCLKEYYSTFLRDGGSTTLFQEARFPFYQTMLQNFCLDQSMANAPIVYQREIKDGMFEAKVGDKECIVKFCTTYCKDAHLACGENAPKLYLCDAETLHSYTVIVMESKLARYFPLSDYPSLVAESRGPLLAILDRLHSKGFVHGDVRSPNILIHPESKHLMLIDFDWSGVAGMAIYPPFLNPALERHAGVQSGELIDSEHDRKAVDLMVEEVAHNTQPAESSRQVESLVDQFSATLSV